MFITNMQRPVAFNKVTKFASNEEKQIPISEEVNEKLAKIADKYGCQLEEAQQIYRNLRSMNILKDASDDEILETVDSSLDPSKRMRTMALQESGYQDPGRMKTQAMIPSEMGWNR